MTGWRVRLAALALAIIVAPSGRAGEAVSVVNRSRPTSCAEEDNVWVNFQAEGIRRFAIEAVHPAYLPIMGPDRMEPDFSRCDMSNDPSFPFAPLDVTLYEDQDYALVGHRFAHFWRPDVVPFRVGDRVTPGLHLVQLIRKLGGRRIEILVLYPADGYWRAKPLPPDGLGETGYGSSFLIGPIASGRRPYVHLSAVEFRRADLSFRLAFDGGGGVLRVADASPARTRLEIALPPSRAGTPFAAIRSMFVSPDMADTSKIRLDDGAPQPVLAFTSGEARRALFFRARPGNHNRSAPDLLFGDFLR